MPCASLTEGLSQLADAHEPALELLGVCSISGTDPRFEPVEALLLAVDELLAIASGVRAERT